MATFNEHINQATKNLQFLVETNSNNSIHWDWQVTVCFYVGVHLINCHLAKIANLHYRTHADVKNAINPHNSLSISTLPEPIYLSYAKLEGLSRRARYLCHDDFQNRDTNGFFTYDKHFSKAVKNLDIILDYFKCLYSLNFDNLYIKCEDLNINSAQKIFKIK